MQRSSGEGCSSENDGDWLSINGFVTSLLASHASHSPDDGSIGQARLAGLCVLMRLDESGLNEGGFNGISSSSHMPRPPSSQCGPNGTCQAVGVEEMEFASHRLLDGSGLGKHAGDGTALINRH